MRRELEEVRRLLEGEKDALSRFEELRKRKDEIEKKEKELLSRLAYLQGEAKALREEEKRIREELKRKEKLEREEKRLKSYKIWLSDFLSPAIDEIELAVLKAINREFELLFKKYFSLLLESPDINVRIDSDFTPIVEQNGYEISVDSLSGGERTSLAFAYRIALNLMVQKVCTSMKESLLILDEPTDGFSKEQIFRMREVLRELNCAQIIIVSHEKELEGFADKIFHVEKVEGESRIRG